MERKRLGGFVIVTRIVAKLITKKPPPTKILVLMDYKAKHAYRVTPDGHEIPEVWEHAKRMVACGNWKEEVL